jgi:hypothetical protein
MANKCVIAANHGKFNAESKAGQKLVEVFGNESDAMLVYDRMKDPEFIEQFGDWVNPGFYNTLSEEQTYRVDENGEPNIKVGINSVYVVLPDNTRLDLGQYANISPKTRPLNNEEISTVAHSIVSSLISVNFNWTEGGFSDTTSAFEVTVSNEVKKTAGEVVESVLESKIKSLQDTINNLTLAEEFTDEISTAIINAMNMQTKLRNTLDNKATLSEVVSNVETQLDKFSLQQTEVQDSAEIKEELIENGSLDIADSIMASFETNSKKDATTLTKRMLSFVPKLNTTTNTPLLDEILGNQVYESYDALWAVLEPALADIHVHLNRTGEFEDLSVLVGNKIKGLIPKNPSFRFVSSLYDSLSDNQKASFISAFNKSSVNFSTSIFSTESGSLQYRVINANSETSVETQLSEEWSENFNSKYKVGNKLIPDYMTPITLDIADYSGDRGIEVAQSDNWKLEVERDLFKYGIEVSQPAILEYIEANHLPEEDIQLNADNIQVALEDFYTSFSRVLSTAIKEPTTYASETKFVKGLASFQKNYRTDLTENTVTSNGAQYWTFANTSFINLLVNSVKSGDFSYLETFESLPYFKNSQWIKQLRHPDVVANLQVKTFNSFKNEENDPGTDNKKIQERDNLIDSLNKTLNGFVENEMSIYTLLTPADKGQNKQLVGFEPVRTNYRVNNEGIGKVTNPEVIDIFSGYVLDEVNRVREVYEEVLNDSVTKIATYHPSNPVITDGVIQTDKKTNEFKGEGLRFQLAGALNYNSETYDEDGSKYMRAIFKRNGELQEDIDTESIREYVEQVLIPNIIDYTNSKAVELGVNASMMNENLFGEEIASTPQGAQVLMADYAINSTIAGIESTKLLIGDPAYYKSLLELSKRFPSTYTDGKLLALRASEVAKGETTIPNTDITYNKELEFTAAVFKDAELKSKYHKAISDAFGKDSVVAKPYSSDGAVNRADAQGYITAERWKFILQRSGKWNDSIHNELYKKLTDKAHFGDNLSKKELKLLAQPLKGVYFSNENGIPTYFKYSQAVLAPRFTEGTPLQKVLDAMVNSGTDELIAESGVKAGKRNIQPLINDNGDVLDDIALKPFVANNTFWKLQQDLPVKGIKQTNIGSQIMKNLFQNFNLITSDFTDYNGKTLSSSEVKDQINDTLRELSDIGRNKVLNRLGINPETLMLSDKSKFYKALRDEIISRGSDDKFLLKMLEEGASLDSFPSYNKMLNNMVASMINKAVTDITTNGGAFIQMSNLGYSDLKAKESSVILFDETLESLKPPLVEDGKVKRGQMLLPYSQVVSILGNSDYAKGEKILRKAVANGTVKDLIGDGVLNAIGYRIPNQGMSSNDALDIVGILPKGMGDTAVLYGEIVTKTGSDFDIDKMFIMLPNLTYDKKSGSVVLNNKTRTSELQNDLIRYYDAILTHPESYKALMTPLDADWLKDDIESLHPVQPQPDGVYFTGAYQVRQKALLMGGKLGVGITANHLVDIPLSQMAGISLAEVYTGGFGKNDIFRFDGTHSGESKALDNQITGTISAFLNAFVDIAKDDYIVRGNYNTLTSNTAFYLLRAGVDKKWVNRFIAQPILLDYVNARSFVLSKTSPEDKIGHPIKFSFAPKMSQAERGRQAIIKYENFRNSDEFAESMNNSLDNLSKAFSKEVLEKDITIVRDDLFDDMSEKQLLDYMFRQEVLYEAFKLFKNDAKLLKMQMDATKVDVNGMGKSFMESTLLKNNYDSMPNQIRNFHRKFHNASVKLNSYTSETKGMTFIGAMYNNSILLAQEIGPQLFITSTPEFVNAWNEISVRLTGKKPTNESEISLKKARIIQNHLYAYLLTEDTHLIADNNQDLPFSYTDRRDLDKLLIDSETRGYGTLLNRLLRYKKENPDVFNENFLLRQLRFNTRTKKISLTTRNKTDSFNDDIKRAWTQLFESSDQKLVEFAEDLIKYSFHTSAFSGTLDKLYENIPNFYLNLRNIPAKIEAKRNEYETSYNMIDVEKAAAQIARNSSKLGLANETYTVKKFKDIQSLLGVSTPTARLIQRNKNLKAVSGLPDMLNEYYTVKEKFEYTDTLTGELKTSTNQNVYRKAWASSEGAVYRRLVPLEIRSGKSVLGYMYNANTDGVNYGYYELEESDMSLLNEELVNLDDSSSSLPSEPQVNFGDNLETEQGENLQDKC